MPDDGTVEVGRAFLDLARGGDLDLPRPGGGRTLDRWTTLASLTARDVALGRLSEGHADAVTILAELGSPVPAGHAWGVWAAAPDSLQARETDGAWAVSGVRPWCSGAGTCTRALVTAAAPDGIRLFAVDVARTEPIDGTWPAVGMAASDTRSVRFDAVPADPVGEPGAYVDRPGFWHGSIGVSACWYGGAVGAARMLLDRVRAGKLAGDPHALAHLGAVEVSLGAARDVLRATAFALDADPASDRRAEALRVRATVERAATAVLDHVGRSTGAGPLCQDREHARRVADLTVYLRQNHAEHDLAALGQAVAATGDAGWGLGPESP